MRIFSQLGEQDPARGRRVPVRLRERWVLVPAGAGLAAAVIAGAVLGAEHHESAQGTALTARVSGDALVDGQPSGEVNPGATLIARSNTWVSVGPDVRVGLAPGTVLRYDYVNGSIALHLFSGSVTVATNASDVNLNGQDWAAVLARGTLISAVAIDAQTTISVEEGSASLVVAGTKRTLGPSDPAAVIGGATTSTTSTADEGTIGPGRPEKSTGAGAGDRPSPSGEGPSASTTPTPGAGQTTAPGTPPAGALATPAAGAGGQTLPGLDILPARPAPGLLLAADPGDDTTVSAVPIAPPSSSGAVDSTATATTPTTDAGSTGGGPVAGGNPHPADDPAGNPHTADDPTGNPHDSSTPAPAVSPTATATPPAPGNSGNAPGHNKDGSGGGDSPQATSTPEPSGPGNSGNAPGHNKGADGTSGHGNSANAPGHNKG